MDINVLKQKRGNKRKMKKNRKIVINCFVSEKNKQKGIVFFALQKFKERIDCNFIFKNRKMFKKYCF